jgi:hypothetical protein
LHPQFVRAACEKRVMSNILTNLKQKANDYCTSKRRREHRKGPQEV